MFKFTKNLLLAGIDDKLADLAALLGPDFDPDLSPETQTDPHRIALAGAYDALRELRADIDATE